MEQQQPDELSSPPCLLFPGRTRSTSRSAVTLVTPTTRTRRRRRRKRRQTDPSALTAPTATGQTLQHGHYYDQRVRTAWWESKWLPTTDDLERNINSWNIYSGSDESFQDEHRSQETLNQSVISGMFLELLFYLDIKVLYLTITDLHRPQFQKVKHSDIRWNLCTHTWTVLKMFSGSILS